MSALDSITKLMNPNSPQEGGRKTFSARRKFNKGGKKHHTGKKHHKKHGGSKPVIDGGRRHTRRHKKHHKKH